MSFYYYSDTSPFSGGFLSYFEHAFYLRYVSNFK